MNSTRPSPASFASRWTRASLAIAGFLVARWVGAAADRRLRRGAMEPPMRILTVRFLRIVVMLMAALVALDRLGFQIAPLVAGIGVAGIGIGFALQGVLSNLVAGLAIIFTKPFRVGEYIKVAGVEGQVSHIDLPSTVLMPADQSRVIVPNRKIVGEILHNFGTIRQLKVGVGVGNPADVARALESVPGSRGGPGFIPGPERGGLGEPVSGPPSLHDAGVV